jgi:hypothetical protein
VIEYGQSRPEGVAVGLLAWLRAKRAKRDDRSASRSGVYSVERSVTTLVRSGRKRRKTTSTTKEWRHGNCQVKHKTKAAATRCRNP